ncbi:MAG TPA: hypothetical protein VFB74_26325, partial [Kribbellaceae bacterium]|nr:hypothetical protein [Kribbellaceae bacterium]
MRFALHATTCTPNAWPIRPAADLAETEQAELRAVQGALVVVEDRAAHRHRPESASTSGGTGCSAGCLAARYRSIS